MRKTIGLLFVAAAIAAIAWFLLHGRAEDVVSDEPAARQASVGTVRKAIPAETRESIRPKPVLGFSSDAEDEEDDLSPEERALAERIEKALDEEDLQAAIACADEAQKCGVVDIRQAMVDTLGWFGEKALPELTPFLADADEDVRENAMNEWSMALSSIEDDGVKISTVELAMGVLRDEDALEEISGEYIGVDEKLAVESLSRIIDGGGPKEGVAKAKETYEFVTGDEWVDAAEAARWIVEEYEPPEKPQN